MLQLISRPTYLCRANDCQEIMEGIRRLLEGTWNLHDEDLLYAWELLPRIRESLEDHIQSEERLLFPKIGFKERNAHQLDHLCLMEQLRNASQALVEMNSDRFHLALATLVKLLDVHHREYDAQVSIGIKSKSRHGFES